MSSARLMSSIVTLQLSMRCFFIIDLKLAVLGHPMIYCTFLALFDPLISLLLKQELLSSAVIRNEEGVIGALDLLVPPGIELSTAVS